MTIETKYNVGNIVWVMKDEPIQTTISGVYVSEDADGICIKYTVADLWQGDTWIPFWNEKFVFPTKEELLKSL